MPSAAAWTDDGGPDRDQPARGSFGAVLRRRRLAARLTQEELANRAGLSTRSVGEIERGRVRHPRPESVRLIGAALGLAAPEQAQFEAQARADYWADRYPQHLVDAQSAQSGAEGARNAEDAEDAEDAGQPELLGSAPRPTPAQLPRDVADFVGRAGLVGDLVARLSSAGDRPAGPAVVITGRPGVGKTALSVHVGHRLRGALPDGQLYVSLGGAAHPLHWGDALGRLLRALGVAGPAVPTDLDERLAEYRTHTADRRLLVVLDDARDEAQVRPLLPSGAGCAALVTSRSRLVALEGAQRVDLDVLTEDEAISLLAAVAGRHRLTEDPAAAAAVVRFCGRLPLAIRVAAARLAGRPGWRVGQLADELADESRRLERLAVGDLDVSSSVHLSYAALSPVQRRAFRLLGLLDAADVAGWVVAALTDTGPEPAGRALDGLVDAHLVDFIGVDGAGQRRYRMHDLVRLFARERSATEDSVGDRRAAVARAASGWLVLAEAADGLLQSRRLAVGDLAPWCPDAATLAVPASCPLPWFEAERAGLVSVTEQAAGAGLAALTWRLAAASVGFLDLRGYWDDWQRLAQQALQASLASGDRRGEATSRYLIGEKAGETGAEKAGEQTRYDEAVVELRAAEALFGRIGDRVGRGRAETGIGVILQNSGDLAGAEAKFRSALRHLDEPAAETARVPALVRLGLLRSRRSDAAAAVALFDRAIRISRRHGYLYGEAWAVRLLGRAYDSLGRAAEARVQYELAVALYDRFGDVQGRAYAGCDLAEAMLRDGLRDPARLLLRESLTSFERLNDGYGTATARQAFGTLRRLDGDIAGARRELAAALRFWRGDGVPRRAASTLEALGEVLLELGDTAAAQAAWTEARELFASLQAREATRVAARLDELARPAAAEGPPAEAVDGLR